MQKKFKLQLADYVMLLILLGVMAFICLMQTGCKSYSEVAQRNYSNGLIQAETIYKAESGWHFWSEGPGKSITISPTVNGVQF